MYFISKKDNLIIFNPVLQHLSCLIDSLKQAGEV